jgi:hypothetical protein
VALDRKLTAIYLNDHLAGSTIGLALARRALSSNRGTPFESFLETLAEQIADDRATLRKLMRTLDIGEDHVKKLAALAAERAGRLKLNGSLLSYSPLSRLVEFEGLALGVTGKLAMWRALQELDDPRLAGFDIAGLAERAEGQRRGIELQRLEAARLALAA